MNKPYKILIAPLDWGMGHVARCIPLIGHCIEKGHNVSIAGNSACETFVKQYFPTVHFIHLKGYDISYSKKAFFFPIKIFFQIPKIISRIYHEYRCLQKWYKSESYDIVISDNRYGLYHSNTFNIILTHQLHISVPQSKLLSRFVLYLNKKLLSHFHQVWVPDIQNDYNNSIAGKLSQKIDSLPNIQYIGILSRFTNYNIVVKHYQVVILLSGPEPQRSILEENLLNFFATVSYPILFIRGKINNKSKTVYPQHIHIENFLDKDALASALVGAHTIICRSGYSTLMDLLALEKKAIIIPTPGQSEQEYLANSMHEKKWFFKATQDTVDWESVLAAYEAFDFAARPTFNLASYKNTMDELFTSIKKAAT